MSDKGQAYADQELNNEIFELHKFCTDNVAVLRDLLGKAQNNEILASVITQLEKEIKSPPSVDDLKKLRVHAVRSKHEELEKTLRTLKKELASAGAQKSAAA